MSEHVAAFPQPREGITGADRASDDLLTGMTMAEAAEAWERSGLTMKDLP